MNFNFTSCQNKIEDKKLKMTEKVYKNEILHEKP